VGGAHTKCGLFRPSAVRRGAHAIVLLVSGISGVKVVEHGLMHFARRTGNRENAGAPSSSISTMPCARILGSTI
jgi:hypothetical protein